MGKWKRELAHKDEHVSKKWKLSMLEVKFKSNVNGIIEEMADCGNVDIFAIWETLDT